MTDKTDEAPATTEAAPAPTPAPEAAKAKPKAKKPEGKLTTFGAHKFYVKA